MNCVLSRAQPAPWNVDVENPLPFTNPCCWSHVIWGGSGFLVDRTDPHPMWFFCRKGVVGIIMTPSYQGKVCMEKGIYFQSSDCKIPTTHDPPEIDIWYIYILNYATFLNRLSHALFFSRWEVVALLHHKIKAKLQCSFRSSIPLAPNCSNQKEAKSCHPPEKLCTCFFLCWSKISKSL